MPMPTSVSLGTIVLAGLLATSACGAKTETPAASSAAAVSTAAPADVQQHNQQDVTFAQQMIPHHQQAVEMSDMILGKTGVDPRVVALAGQIKTAQGPEIEQMKGWLTQWGAPTMPAAPGMDHGGMDHGGMPGMAGMMSAQDMEALQNADGADASRLFLTQMITHHQGAVTMAQTEITSGAFAPAVALARSIVTGQQKEIDEMQSMLASI